MNSMLLSLTPAHIFNQIFHHPTLTYENSIYKCTHIYSSKSKKSQLTKMMETATAPMFFLPILLAFSLNVFRSLDNGCFSFVVLRHSIKVSDCFVSHHRQEILNTTHIPTLNFLWMKKIAEKHYKNSHKESRKIIIQEKYGKHENLSM